MNNRPCVSTQGLRSCTQFNSKGKIDLQPILNTLDKCTQILREDRLWTHNELKSGNQQLLQIFLGMRKPLNMQQLQIKLRKYIAGMKSKAKMEQLLKFKENLYSGHLFDKKKLKSQKTQRNVFGNAENALNSTTKGSNLSKELRKSTERNYSSKPLIYPYRYTSSSKGKTDYDVPMGAISERDSENLTSQRHFMADDGFKGNQLKSFNSNHGLSYNQWKRPSSNNTNSLLKLAQEVKNQIQVEQFSNEKSESHQSSKKDSFCGSSIKRPEIQYQNDEEVNEQKSINFFEINHEQKSHQPAQQSVLQYPQFESRKKQASIFDHEQNQEPQKNQIDLPPSSDGLFTSPQLLLQCRKYTKSSLIDNDYLKSDKQFEECSSEESSIMKILREVKNGELQPIPKQRLQKIQAKQVHSDYLQTFEIINEQENQESFPSMYVPKEQQPKEHISTQKIMHTILGYYPSKYILITNLFTIIENYFPELSAKLVAVLQKHTKQTINLADLCRLLGRDPVEMDNECMYYFKLFDQDGKGFIDEENIDVFLNELNNAAGDEIDMKQIEQALWKVYMEAIGEEKKNAFDYWDFYCSKQTDEFKQMVELLQPFDFEIVNNQ